QIISSWLSPLKYFGKQQRLMSECVEPCGQWFLNSEEFLYWVEVQNFRLQCWGDAGSGKTMISSIVVNHLQQYVDTSSCPVMVIYLDHTQGTQQEPVYLLGSLLDQLIGGSMERHQAVLTEPYARSRKGQSKPYLCRRCRQDQEESCSDKTCVRNMLYAELRRYTRSFLVVDALDECSEEVKQ
ncbi:hypothetical protein BT63DRAFT_364141, partial [Microthyrium microscopicum]